ncbi:pyridoxamine 5'-phosphate oxidase-domain-containing protein [Radiomyces spectabilis]|uniref:pyridoxamine 5'-phosphate oxidase-domain-containing protein n=1 Tax=Radiomyces spectabilis TaxID=64574 RepID=UPI00221FD832|nr:pyridoxamine 5'-phosphate oxidase-domain-containing protein [Radiomyces spectabilis]KAI8371537.1 pyridoxamine 5'-phosphate oxidase-domain-containing protein [Radiomyces spectabilis]
MRVVTCMMWMASLAYALPHGCVDTQQSVDAAAKLARTVISDTGIGTIMTLMDGSINPDFEGHPFGLMEYYNGDCYKNGDLLLFMSDLQMNARNAREQPNKVSFTVRALKDYNPSWGNRSTPVEQPRVAMMGEIKLVNESPNDDELMKCFATKHPEAKAWQQFHDFHFYRFQVESLYYVGGFGGINYIGWLPLHKYQHASNHGHMHLQ